VFDEFEVARGAVDCDVCGRDHRQTATTSNGGDVKFGEVSKMTTPFRSSLWLCGGSGECRIRPEDPAHVAQGPR
jgi:hypothetical protein